MSRQKARCRACERIFSAQDRDLLLPTEGDLPPHAAVRVASEAASYPQNPRCRQG